MNRIVVSTVAMLVAVVGFAMVGEDQEANAGLFGGLVAAAVARGV